MDKEKLIEKLKEYLTILEKLEKEKIETELHIVIKKPHGDKYEFSIDIQTTEARDFSDKELMILGKLGFGYCIGTGRFDREEISWLDEDDEK